jgi:hypothetical protein
MARQGQQLSSLPKQASIPSQEEEPACPALTTTMTFPAITQVNTSTCNSLITYFQNKVACFNAGRLREFHNEWMFITSDAEILDMVLGQKLEFSLKPFQLFVPKERTYDHIQTQAEIETLLKKGVVVLTEHEKGEYISLFLQQQKRMGQQE